MTCDHLSRESCVHKSVPRRVWAAHQLACGCLDEPQAPPIHHAPPPLTHPPLCPLHPARPQARLCRRWSML